MYFTSEIIYNNRINNFKNPIFRKIILFLLRIKCILHTIFSYIKIRIDFFMIFLKKQIHIILINFWKDNLFKIES